MLKGDTAHIWAHCMHWLAQHLQACAADPVRSVVLLPYAQLLPVARQQWMALFPTGLLPRFETTSNWAQQVQPFVPGADDIAFDAARDVLVAQRLLQQAGLQPQAQWLSGRVREAALQLAPQAAAMPLQARLQWARAALPALRSSMEAQALQLETAVASVALAWVGHSAYASDALWPLLQRGQVDALIVLQGFQRDALAQALLALQQQIAPGSALALDLAFAAPADKGAQPAPMPQAAALRLHVATDMEDQAQLAAACVQRAVAQQQGLVALVDVDRALTRRIRATLGEQGVTMRDETGWKLSTTHAASHVMLLLRACVPQTTSDAVLAWLKLAQSAWRPGAADAAEMPPVPVAYVSALEAWLRRHALAQWPDEARWQVWQHPAGAWARQVAQWRTQLQAPRGLRQWLTALAQGLQASGQWRWLQVDEAGQALLRALHLDGLDEPAQEQDWTQTRHRWTLADFTGWAGEVLEAGSFRPPYPLREQVVIAPLSQLLGRDFAAVVLPGCDAQRLPAAPEPPGDWTGAQRQLLGLPDRAELQRATRAAWQQALACPQVDVLTSRSDSGGEALQHSPLLLEWLLQQPLPASADAAPPATLQAADPRHLRRIAPQPGRMPRPDGAALPLAQLSASAYDSLRTCPYQFFARQLLRLHEVPELSGLLEKRDFGVWLHATLLLFHTGWQQQALPLDCARRIAITTALDAAAAQAQAAAGLDAAAFLPFAAAWPRLREGYVDWLLGPYAALGAQFAQGEAEHSLPLADALRAAALADADAADWGDLAAIQLKGTLDRIDTLPVQAAQPDAARWLLLDYKTESDSKTRKRVSQSDEDTQLPFYAALLAPQPVRVGYANVAENGSTALHEQADVPRLRDQLLQGMAHDLRRVRAGSPLPALGQGAACDWCSVRGLCRRDFWEDAA